MTDLLESIRRHSNTAIVIARGFCRKLPKSVPREDIEQAALIGLFEWKRNHPNEEDPGWMGGLRTRVRGSIVDELRRQDWLPRYTRRDHGHLRVVGFDDVDTDWDAKWASSAASVESALETKQEFEEAMRAPLLPRDAEVLDLHYFRGVKFRDIGEHLGVSEPRISQLHSRAIGKMRAHLEGNEQELAVARRQVKRAERLAAKESNVKPSRPS